MCHKSQIIPGIVFSDKDMSGFTSNRLPPNNALPSRTATQVYNANPRPVGPSRGFNSFIPIQNSYVPLQNSFLQPNPLMAPPSMHFVPMSHQNIQPLPQNFETRPHIPGQTNFVPEVMLPNGMKMCPVGLLNGELLYKVTTANFTAPPPPTVTKPKKKPKKVDDQYTEQTYVKKPLNAFMLFSKEHRQGVKDRSASTNIAVINETLGKMWHLLPEEEKAKFHELAEKEKRLHSQQHPDWSCRHNYGKKRYNKRIRDLTTGSVQATSTSELQEEPGAVDSEDEDSPASLSVDSTTSSEQKTPP
ncbi:uncharacterized protein ACBT44_012072 [Syngnathus typhle]